MYRQLASLSRSDMYPFHMPGHKRLLDDELLGAASRLDITEIEGFDNLHHSAGIIEELKERVRSKFGGDRAYILVNGSTSGVLSAIMAAVPRGGKIVIGRNSHRSAYNAAYLNELDCIYLYPPILPLDINGGISASDVEKALDGVSAVFITSPTYEGIVSDVEAIADVCHKRGVILIVDSAHGAHFGLYEPFVRDFNCKRAIDCKADIVIESLHKSLPSFTQSAVMLVNQGIVDMERLNFFYSVFTTSSPSYLFMAGIDRCIDILDSSGLERFKRLDENLNRLWHRAAGFERIKIEGFDFVGDNGVFGFDPTKIIVSCRGMNGAASGSCGFGVSELSGGSDSGGLSDGFKGMSGSEIAQILRREYHIESEMACGSYCLLMSSMMDSDEGFSRLIDALTTMDKRIM